MTTAAPLTVRSVATADLAQWRVLFDGYNAFYGRSGSTALAAEVIETTWRRFFDPGEPVRALVAAHGSRLVGLAHYLLHRSTIHIEPVCYLQDLFTAHAERGRGIGRTLIAAVCAQARASGASRVYWHTHESNATARRLYDRVAERPGFILYRVDT
jgi:GNAT superfamily N-acetyltransferase